MAMLVYRRVCSCSYFIVWKSWCHIQFIFAIITDRPASKHVALRFYRLTPVSRRHEHCLCWAEGKAFGSSIGRGFRVRIFKKAKKILLKMDTKQKCLGIKGINSEMPRYVSCETWDYRFFHQNHWTASFDRTSMLIATSHGNFCTKRPGC